jgi:hypothetical protein
MDDLFEGMVYAMEGIMQSCLSATYLSETTGGGVPHPILQTAANNGGETTMINRQDLVVLLVLAPYFCVNALFEYSYCGRWSMPRPRRDWAISIHGREFLTPCRLVVSLAIHVWDRSFLAVY